MNDDGDGRHHDNDDNNDNTKKEMVHKYILYQTDRMLYTEIH
jgi:hypothetical protein